MRKLFILWLAVLVFIPMQAANQFKVRGMHIDMRTQAMTMTALKALASDAASGGINTLIMEWEGTFPFDKHATLSNGHSYTREEVADFIRHCSSLGIDVIPLQNCFGHCEYILSHMRYRNLRESKTNPSQVCPLCPDCEQVFREVFSEIAALHPSKYIHIGADETRLLGFCPKCKAKVEKEGTSKLFVDYVNKMCSLVRELGKTPIIWADILLKYPEAAGELPHDIVLIDWNYGWEVDKFGNIDAVMDAGYEVWGAPALRSYPDNIYITQWSKHFRNLADFVPFARSKGYTGMIETSWSTSGEYGYLFDDHHEFLNILPIRQVYPLQAFRILQKAYCESLRDDQPLDWEAFIRNYGSDRFALSDADCQTFLSYFAMDQKPVTDKGFNKENISAELKNCSTMLDAMRAIRVRKNNQEFQHFILMLEIRRNFLSFKSLECADSTIGMDSLLREARILQTKVAKANRDYLKDPHEPLSEDSYIRKMESMCKVKK